VARSVNWTSGGIQTETYGFTRQKTHGGPRNLILISDMSFLVDFRPEKTSREGHKNNEGILLANPPNAEICVSDMPVLKAKKLRKLPQKKYSENFEAG
jgi:hypothetical protein